MTDLPQQKKLTSEEIEELAESYRAEARENFAVFRRHIRPDMLWGWWTEEVAQELQRFYRDLTEGRRPKLALLAPPQHGKSWTIFDFIAWMAGKQPDAKTVFASYSDELGIAANRGLERTIKSEAFARIFPDTRIDVPGWQCSADLIEYVGHTGSFRNTTVNGAITGFGLNLGVIDDPVKGRAEANSKITRDRVWNWFTDDFLTRFAENAGLLVIMTRWHVDDLLGRALNKFSDLRVVRHPAVSGYSRDGQTRNWSDRRATGEALFPEWKPMDFLLERKSALTDASWESLYQQEPYVVGGGQLPIEKMKFLPYWDRSRVIASVRYVDKAGTDAADGPGSAYTAGCLMHLMSDKTYVIEHVGRGQWSALERERKIKAWADADAKIYKSYQLFVEQEPGSGGKESAESTVRNNPAVRAFADRVTGSKETRAEPFAAQVQNGSVSLVAGEWVTAFLDECEAWPMSRYKDQVDAAAGAFSKLVVSTSYNTNYKDWAY
jgi:predicted phage terminase large subunit-like protein